MSSKFFVQEKTFRSKKNFAFLQNNSKRDDLQKYIVKTMGGGTLKDAVLLPPGQNKMEWLAINTVDFFNEINMIYGCISEFCTEQSCPTMTAGKRFEYLLWGDPKKGTKPSMVPARTYVSTLMEWIEDQLDDETVFPHSGIFPENFETNTIPTIFKRLFRVYAHIYHLHLEKIESLGEVEHLNTCFKHFIYFVVEFKLVDEQEQKPLANVISQIMENKST